MEQDLLKLPSKPLSVSENAPAWLSDSAFNKSDIARRVGLTPGSLNVKLSGFNYNKLTSDNLAALEKERLRLLELLALSPESPTVE